MKIGNVLIDGFVCLAPMAGVADRAVREISRSFGVGYTVGEMTSAKGIVMNSEKSRELLIPDEAHPYGVQLFGADPECMFEGVGFAALGKPDIIDINMGCPAPKVTMGGAGSALLKDIKTAQAVITAAVRAAGEIPVTAKIRKGFEKGDDVAVEFAKMLEQSGVAAITVHARTRAQMYAPPIDIDCITRVKSAVSIPVIGNGDIFSQEDAVRMFEVTGCDLVMVGRGALGNPWIFRQINQAMAKEEVSPPPCLTERMEVMKAEIRLLVRDKGEYIGFREARKHVAWYMTGLKGASALRRLCSDINCVEDVERIALEAIRLNQENE